MVLLYIFGFVVLINCLYYLLFTKFAFLHSTKKSNNELFPISLIVCAKNESENLKTHIPYWLEQEYPDFEIILINDASYDDTLEVMESFAEKNSNIKIVDVENNEAFWGSKKYALTLGIKKAAYHRLIFTDADCKPSSNLWLKEITSKLKNDKQIVLGFGAYQKLSGFLNKLIRFETLMTAIQYFSYAKAGMPYMGVGRNIGYTSKLFYDNNGFMSHMDILSGDDDLFVNQAATSKNTAICFSEESFTYSVPKKSWKEWLLQKKRHVTTAKHYKFQHKFLLGLYYSSQLLFWILTFASFLLLDWKIPMIIISFRFIFQYLIIGKSALKLKQKDLIYLLPIWELLLVLTQLSIFISNSSSKPTKWK